MQSAATLALDIEVLYNIKPKAVVIPTKIPYQEKIIFFFVIKLNINIKTLAKPRKYVVKDVGSENLRPSFNVKAYTELKIDEIQAIKTQIIYIYYITFKIN